MVRKVGEYQWLRDNNICVWCREKNDRKGAYCTACVQKIRLSQRKCRQKKRLAGICYACPNKSVEGKVLCSACMRRNNESRRNKICIKYHKEEKIPGKNHCQTCNDKSKEEDKTYHKNRRQTRIAQGKCVMCCAAAIQGKTLCIACKNTQAARNRLYVQKKKAAGLCTLCKNPALPGYAYCQKCRAKYK